ncbi:hypothetical protein Pan153_05600 [Gimesia panareensis]|uniref:Uncharacterized protein n=1 Tax=Gimesia panareensis TaxID=2527978 RepID=A0A518FHX3_9PLAN|nr:hypothetical protein [Gimesia panareensis]QDV15941.1 hypothetical protein Pan153_05600 [Gimesia panareensis]
MSLTKLSRLFVVLATVSISIWAVGCGKPASEAPAPAEEPAASAPAGEAPEAGSTTGGAGAEVPEGGEESKPE